MVFCLVQGDAIKNSFPIDIDTNSNATIGHLKAAIKSVKPNTFGSIDANKPRLWKVDIIQNKENQNAIIKEHEGEELHPFQYVEKCFEKNLTSTNIRIIVEPPATTGKCLPMVYLSNKKFALSHIFLNLFLLCSAFRKNDLPSSNRKRSSRSI